MKISATSTPKGADEITRVTLENTGKSLAFSVRLKVNQGAGGEEILPVIWQDNYVSLLPGEKREITATYAGESLKGAEPSVEVNGWNVAPQTAPAPVTAAVWPARVFAPYAFIPKGSINIADGLGQSGQRYYTLAFIVSDPDGYPAWTGSRDLRVSTKYYANEIQAIRARGGDVLISFGGADGHELAINTQDVGELEQKYQSVIDNYQLTWMDFDIEGKALSNTAANQRRDEALEHLERKNPGLKISFTLPVNPTGVEKESLVMLRDAVTRGLKIESVDVMTMDYGAALSRGKKMGDLAVSAANATRRQIQEIDPAVKIGICPMIGVNDEKGRDFHAGRRPGGHGFRIDHRLESASVGFWSSNRDRPKGARKGSNHTSGIDQKPWEFTEIFKPLSD